MPPRDWTSPNNDLQFRGDALNRIIIHPLRFQLCCFENSSLSPPWGPQKIWTPDFRPPEAPAPLGDQFCLKHTPFLKWLAAGKSKALRVQTMSVVNGHVSQFWLQFFRKKWGGFLPISQLPQCDRIFHQAVHLADQGGWVHCGGRGRGWATLVQPKGRQRWATALHNSAVQRLPTKAST